jgi:hypothetical protein
MYYIIYFFIQTTSESSSSIIENPASFGTFFSHGGASQQFVKSFLLEFVCVGQLEGVVDCGAATHPNHHAV